MQRQRTTRAALTMYVSCMATFALFVVNWRHPFLRLDNELGNTIVGAAAWMLPLIGFVVLIPSVRDDRRALVTVAVLPLFATGAIVAPFEVWRSTELFTNGNDSVFEPIQRIPVPGGSQVVLYRFSCAIGCGVIMTVRQEVTIAGPVRLVRNLWVTDDSVEVYIIGDRKPKAMDHEMPLLRHVAFSDIAPLAYREGRIALAVSFFSRTSWGSSGEVNPAMA